MTKTTNRNIKWIPLINHRGIFPSDDKPISSRHIMALMLLLLGGTASAEDAARQYHIPAQSLNNALLQFASDSNLELIIKAGKITDLNAKTLDGTMTPRQALDQLLKGSGYTYHFIDSHTVTLDKAPVENKKAEPTVLKTVSVKADAIRDVKDPYNQDYVLPDATTGTKTDTPIMETPLNVQSISKQVLKDQQVINLGDALKNVSGVTLGINNAASDFPNGLNQSIVVRGFNSDTYFRNGFRLQQGSAQREMANVESIEVLKGSGAILYGMVEPGGMVNVITKQPQATPYYAVNQQFGSYDMYRTTADATGPIAGNKDVLYRVNMSYQNSGSFREYVNNEKFYIAPIVKWNISTKTQVTAELEYGHNNIGLDTGLVLLQNDKFQMNNLSVNYGQPFPAKQDNILGSINWSHQFSDDWSIKHSMNANQSKTNSMGLQAYPPFFAGVFIPGSPTDQVALGLFKNGSTNDTYSTNIDLTGHFNTAWLKHTLLLGGDYYRVNNDYSLLTSVYNFAGKSYLNPTQCSDPYCGLVIDPTSNYLSPKSVSTTDQYGLYLQDQIKLPYDVHVTGGFRYQNIHQAGYSQNSDLTINPNQSLSADAVTPRVGILWHPQKWVSLYSNYTENFGANLGNVYTGPNINDQKAATPTSSQQYEVGVKNEFFGGRLRTTFAYYELTKQNVVTGDPNTLHCGGTCVLLTGAVRSRGPELDIQGEILPGWKAIATYANTDIIVTKAGANDYPAAGSRYWGVPRNTASLWNTYDFQQDPLKGFNVGGGVTLRDGSVAYNYGQTGPDTIVPGYATIDLLAGYNLKLGKSKVSVQFNVNNLLDKHYYTQASVYPSSLNNAAGVGGGFASFGQPRTFMGSIKVEF